MKKRIHCQRYTVTFCSGATDSSGSVCSVKETSTRGNSMDRKQDSSTDLLLVEQHKKLSQLSLVSQGRRLSEDIMEPGASGEVTRVRDKFRGCLLGALVGDCVGSLFERDYTVSYKVLEDLYHSLTNLSEDEKLMDLHGIDMSLGPAKVREILEQKRQSCASSHAPPKSKAQLQPEAVLHLRRNSALASGTPTKIPSFGAGGVSGERRGSTKRPIERYSDDTVMTKSVLSSLVVCKGQYNAQNMARRLTEDYFLNLNRKYSPYIRDIFVQLRENGYQEVYNPAKKSAGGIGAQGNEAASRVSPVALWCSWGGAREENTTQMLVDLAGKQAKISNAHRTSVHGAVLQALAIYEAFNWDTERGSQKCKKCVEALADRENQGLGLTPGGNATVVSSRNTSPLLVRRRGSLAQGLGNTSTSARNSLGEVFPGGPRILVEQQPKYFCEQLLDRMSVFVEGRPNSLFENLKHLVQQSVTGSGKELLKPGGNYSDKLRTILEFLQRSQPPTRVEVVERLGNGFRSIDSVPAAIYSFLFAAKNEVLPGMPGLVIKSGVVRTIFYAISLGGETDTVASMAGAIAGAYWGSQQVPEEILRVSEGSPEIVKLADELFNLSLKNRVMGGTGGGGGGAKCQSCHQPYN